MYDPTIGVWISEDPIGFEAGDENLRRYVGNDPVSKTDPSGLAPPVMIGGGSIQSATATDKVLAPFVIGSGDIEATISIDASKTKGQALISDPANFNPRKTHIGIEVLAADSKADQKVGIDGKYRFWASFKRLISAEIRVEDLRTGKITTTPLKGSSYKPDATWVFDGSISRTTTPYHDFHLTPARMPPPGGPNIWKYLTIVEDHALIVFSPCLDTNGNLISIDPNAISVMQFQMTTTVFMSQMPTFNPATGVSTTQLNESVTVSFNRSVKRPLPDPGWKNILEQSLSHKRM